MKARQQSGTGASPGRGHRRPRPQAGGLIDPVLRFAMVAVLCSWALGVFALQAGQPVSGPAEEAAADACTPAPITVPTLPEQIPGYTELDPATNLHVTGVAQEIDLETYVLEVDGKVGNALRLSYDDIRCLPRIEARPVLECPGFFVDVATWSGVPLAEILRLAEPRESATHLRFVGADGYSSVISTEKALSAEGYLAYELEGEPVPVLHGFPVRAVFPGLAGSTWVKWLVRIEVQ